MTKPENMPIQPLQDVSQACIVIGYCLRDEIFVVKVSPVPRVKTAKSLVKAMRIHMTNASQDPDIPGGAVNTSDEFGTF
jgi:hypothetical protein